MQSSFNNKGITPKWMLKGFLQNLTKPLRPRIAKKMIKPDKFITAIATVVFLCGIATLFVVQGNSRKVANSSEKVEPSFVATEVAGNSSGAAPHQPPQRAEKEEGEVITIIPSGFDPKVITRPKGRFTLLVDNRSGLEEVQLRLDRVAGNRLHDVQVPRQKLDWIQGVDLHPGTYVLTEANHPEWSCTITVTAN